MSTPSSKTQLMQALYAVLLCGSCLLAATPAAAQIVLLPAPADALVRDTSVIGEGAMSGVSGISSVNSSAGDFNQQANVRAISINPGGTANAQNQVNQFQGPEFSTPVGQADVQIRAGAFTGSMGVMGVNQAAGIANRQVNGLAIGIGTRVEAVGDSTLATTAPRVSSLGGNTPGASSNQKIGVDDTAFQGARGILQLNQTAGTGNRSANTLGIQISR